MILTGRSMCLPSQATVQELFSVARDSGIIPDVSLDPVLASFLSLDSSDALQHQFAFLQRGLSAEQRAAFRLGLAAEFGGSRRVTHGGVGVVALALSLLFDQVAQQVRTQGSTNITLPVQRPRVKTVFGISSSSRIGLMVHSYLGLVPGIANDPDKMAETTELYDNWLKLELLDHYERMTTKKRMSSVSMQQWLVGAAVHLHIRIHQVRLHSVPTGSAESLRLSYTSGLTRLIQGYTAYLHRNVKETGAGTKTRTRHQTQSNMTCISSGLFNVSVVKQKGSNDTTTTAGPALCQTGADVRGRQMLNGSSSVNPDVETVSSQGLLVIEQGRNVSHEVQHHACQAPAIQQALVTRIMNAQDLDRNRNFFLYPDKVFRSLLRQREDFELKTD